MSKQADQIYQSFLVRCWLIPPAAGDEPPTWRFELRDVSAEPQKHRFSDLEQLKDFINAELTAVVVSHERDGGSEDSRKGDELWQGD